MISNNRYLAEVIGTFGIVFAGCGAIAATLHVLFPKHETFGANLVDGRL